MERYKNDGKRKILLIVKLIVQLIAKLVMCALLRRREINGAVCLRK